MPQILICILGIMKDILLHNFRKCMTEIWFVKPCCELSVVATRYQGLRLNNQEHSGHLIPWYVSLKMPML